MPPESENKSWAEWRNVILQNQDRYEEQIRLLHERISDLQKTIDAKLDLMKNAAIGGLVVILVQAFFLIFQ